MENLLMTEDEISGVCGYNGHKGGAEIPEEKGTVLIWKRKNIGEMKRWI